MKKDLQAQQAKQQREEGEGGSSGDEEEQGAKEGEEEDPEEKLLREMSEIKDRCARWACYAAPRHAGHAALLLSCSALLARQYVGAAV